MNNSNVKKYLVTGGTGFIGAALVKRLVIEGHSVRVLDNNSRGSTRRLFGLADDSIEYIEGDIRDPQVCNDAVRDMDCVIHLAFVNGTEFFYSKPRLVLEVGVKGITNILDACLLNKVGDLIVASSSEVYQTPPNVPTAEDAPLSVPDPLNPRYSYGGGKIISELMAINYGREDFDRVVIFRPHNVFGPDMGWEHVIPQFALRMLTQLERGEKFDFPIQGDGTEQRAFIYIDDFISGLMSIINKGEHLQIYHIGTEQETTIQELAQLVGTCLDANIKVVAGELSEGSTLRRCPDTRKLRALGFHPEWALQDALQSTVDWYRDNRVLAPKL
jgi:nucleoside-diphosphate-sugar epimerase